MEEDMSGHSTAAKDEHLKHAWRRFVEHHSLEDNDKLRPVILSSWKRCSSLHVNPWQKSVPNKLEETELAKLKREHREFLRSCMSILYELYVSIQNAPFVITVAAPSGIILKTIGNSDALEMVRPGNYVEGADWSEASAGTNGVGTAIATGAPVQVYSYEHYCRCSQHFTCSSSPVRDSLGKLMGVITITGRDIDANDFTMGMIIATAEVIESRIRLERVRRENRNGQLYRNTLMNLVARGALVIGTGGEIYDINNEAIRMLQLEGEINYSGKRLQDLMSKENAALCERICREEILTDEPVTVVLGRSKRRMRVTVRPFYDVDGIRVAGTVIFDEDVSSGKKRASAGKARLHFSDLVGESELHRKTIKTAKQAALSDSTILILGESGTGKGMLAEAIHNGSRRRKGPFISINCGAIPKSLIASELFGYVEGAFTGARRGGQIGKLEAAQGGTVFLDEIGDMPMSMQVNLLQVIENRSIVRVGGIDEIPIDVRFIAATNKNLREEIRKGRFREDLYYRLNVISIRQPALRERPEDIGPLVRAFYSEYCSREELSCSGAISPDYIQTLSAYRFPGDIRELRNLVERTVFLSPDGTLSTEYLPDDILAQIGKKREAAPDERGRQPEEDEAARLRELLRRHKGNVTKAAAELNVARSTLYRRMRRLGIEEN